jgi:prolyl-tRNA synthetase
MAETEQLLEVYADCLENCWPCLSSGLHDREGKVRRRRRETYTVECMRRITRRWQSGTSHYFGDGFCRAFDITFSDKNNQLSYPLDELVALYPHHRRAHHGPTATTTASSCAAIAPVQVVVVRRAAQDRRVLEKPKRSMRR